VPVQFQGKTIRDVQLNSEDKAIAQAYQPEKPIALLPLMMVLGLTTTSQVLDVLKKNNVKATFFMVGKQVQKHPQLDEAGCC
jgi:hypothetical protein